MSSAVRDIGTYEENIINKQIQMKEKFSKLGKKEKLTTDETVYLYTDMGEYAISFEFTEEDIMRSELVKFIINKLKTLEDK